MIRYKVTVAYCGQNYAGWQTQRRNDTIQEHLETVLSKICNENIVITGSGRTDAGVSAAAQVFHFDTNRDMSSYKWYGAINAFLPSDIHVKSVERVRDTFHARYSVRWKKYCYRVNMGEYDVFSASQVYQYGRQLDVEKIREASKYLLGTHDFTSFNASSLKEYPDQRRPIYNIEIVQKGNVLEMYFCGKGFLRYMVRMMSGVLIEVGKGNMEPIEVKNLLEKRSKTAVQRNAPANGLTLEEVKYFETACLNEEGMIRDYLEFDEEYPKGLTFEKLENDTTSRYLVMTERKSQNQLASIEILEDKVIVSILKSEGLRIYQDLEKEFLDWLQYHEYTENVMIEGL